MRKALLITALFGLFNMQSAWGYRYLPDELVRALPSAARYLQNSQRAGSLMQDGLVQLLETECAGGGALIVRQPKLTSEPYLSSCELLEKIHRYLQLVDLTANGRSGVEVLDPLPPTEQSARKPWDLSAILSGNFIWSMSSVAEEGAHLVSEMFATRQLIVHEIDKIFTSELKRTNSPEMYLRRAFWHSYILSISPIGALKHTFQNIRCGLHNRSCEVIKSLWGSVCNIVIETHQDQIRDLNNRFQKITQDFADEKQSRLGQILVFHELVESGIKNKDDFFHQLKQHEGQGLGNFKDYEFGRLAREVLIYSELKSLSNLQENCSPYHIDLSPTMMEQLKQELLPITSAPLEQLETALQAYEIINGHGGGVF